MRGGGSIGPGALIFAVIVGKLEIYTLHKGPFTYYVSHQGVGGLDPPFLADFTIDYWLTRGEGVSGPPNFWLT